MNREKFDKVIEFVEAHPENYNQMVWVDGFAPGYESESLCGSTACIAGWAAVLNGWQLDFHDGQPSSFVEKNGVCLHIESAAMVELEITVNQAKELFNGDNTLDDVKSIAGYIDEL